MAQLISLYFNKEKYPEVMYISILHIILQSISLQPTSECNCAYTNVLTFVKVFPNSTRPLSSKSMEEVWDLFTVVSNLMLCNLKGILFELRFSSSISKWLIDTKGNKNHLCKGPFDASKAVINFSCIK